MVHKFIREEINLMQVKIEKSIGQKFPDIKVYSLVVRLSDNYNLLPLEIPLVKEEISDIPVICQWREIYRSMGIKPTKFLSSIESLIKRFKKNNWMTGINLVDFYNSLSIKHLAPIGIYDLSRINDLEVRFMQLNDAYNPLNSDKSFENSPKIMVYAHFHNIVCWAINHRDSADYCLNSNTKEILVVSEGFTTEQSNNAIKALEEFREICIKNNLKTSTLYHSVIYG